MRNVCFKKGLVVGIIVLFLGVGFQPALANEVAITQTSDVEEDCGCNEVINPKLVFISNLLERVENYVNYIQVKYGYIPDIEEKCNEILTNINLRFQAYELICDFLWDIYEPISSFQELLQEIGKNLEDNPIMRIILESIFYLSGVYAVFLNIIGMGFDCDWAQFP